MTENTLSDIPPGARLVQRRDSPVWYAVWYDPEARRGRRRSTGTTDRATAEARLAGCAAACPAETRTAGSGADAARPRTVRAVLQFYHARHAARLASAEQAAIAIRHLTGVFGDLTGVFGDMPVGDLADETRQQVYVDHRYNEGGVSAGTIDRELSVLRAAIRFCGKRWPARRCPTSSRSRALTGARAG